MDSYPIPASTQVFEREIKRSRFIASIGNINSRAEARDFVQQISANHPTASHHCWAYIAGQPDDDHQYDQSDDGEPKGTAGKPMLTVLVYSGLGNTIAVVSRYFGGIKLGTGGLARAYSQSVSESLKQLRTIEHQMTLPLTIQFAYPYQGKLDHYFAGQGISISSQAFGAEVSYTLAIPVSQLERTKTDLVTHTQGQVKIQS